MLRRAGIYIHIPFCARKCTYCNFNTTDYVESLAERYIDALAAEISYWGESLRAQFGRPLEVDSIYFGGGTPSIVEPGQLAAIVDCCKENLHVVQGAEVTIEINPGAFSRAKIEGWLACGINRASVGVQSFIDRELVSLSRTHTANDAFQTIQLLRESGMRNISLDLIAGLPEQSLSDWESNLREALAIRPEHLSLYLLEVKEGTQLHLQLKRGLRPEPDDDLAAEMYRMICDSTGSAGYEQYEISNFARHDEGGVSTTPSRFRSLHNLKYWNGAPVYGIGCGAHSYDGLARWSNVLKTESYIEQVALTGHAIGERRDLSQVDRAAEALFMGLRLKEGVNLVDFRSRYGVDVLSRFGGELPRLAEAGLVEVDDHRLKLTAAGRLLSNEVFVSFI